METTISHSITYLRELFTECRNKLLRVNKLCMNFSILRIMFPHLPCLSQVRTWVSGPGRDSGSASREARPPLGHALAPCLSPHLNRTVFITLRQNFQSQPILTIQYLNITILCSCADVRVAHLQSLKKTVR